MGRMEVEGNNNKPCVDDAISVNINSVHQFTKIDESLAQSDRVMSDEESLRRAVYYDRQARSMRKTYELDEALRYYKKSVTIKLNTLGENHPDVAASYNNIGIVYRDKGELDKALEYYNKSLTIRLNTLGENHPRTADTLYNMGLLYKSQMKLNTASEYLNRALVIFCNKLGEGHKKVRETRKLIQTIKFHKYFI